MGAPMQVLNFEKWISENKEKLKPPVCNKEVYRDGDMIIMVVGGPNGRKDFHYNEGPEFFYQLEGELLLRTQQEEGVVEYRLAAGDIFLLPPKVPHSPVRFENSIGLVIEQVRRPDEIDALMWFCEKCNHKLYQEKFPLRDIENDFGAVFARFLGSEEFRTCDKCGDVMLHNKFEFD